LDFFYSEKYPELDVLTKQSVLDWMSYRSGASRIQLSHDAIAIRHLGEYMLSVGERAYILPTKFVPKSPRSTPYIFTDSELGALFQAADTLPKRKDCFEHEIAPVLFRLIYTCGLRPNEGRELMRNDINLDTGEIFIAHNRVHKERIVVMSDDMLKLCLEYDPKRLLFAPKNMYFFPHERGDKYSNEQTQALFRKCWKYANASIPPASLPRVRVYDLRHRFASAVMNNWLNQGCDLYAKLPYLRAYMGHEEIDSTAYYIHLLPENIMKSKGIDWASLNSILPEVD
jgi:integrase